MLTMIAMVCILALATIANALDETTGNFLTQPSPTFRSGYITGFLSGVFAPGPYGVHCPIMLSGAILEATLAMRVQSGDIPRSMPIDAALVNSLTSLGCTAPWGTKGERT